MRPDGKRVKNLKPFFEIVPYIMNKRVDAQNYITQEVDIAPKREYINSKRGQGLGLSHLSIVIAAYVRLLKEFNQLNHFVVNKKIYERNHICISFVTLKDNGGDEEIEQTVIKLEFDKDDDIFEVTKKINDAIEENRKVETKNNMDKFISKLMHIPGLATGAVGFLKFLDRYGLMPRFVVNLSPFHTSMFITNMASIRSNHIYHHLYEFGTTSVFLALGQHKKQLELQKDGTVAEKIVMPIGVVTDERIASGHYYTSAFRRFEKYLLNPQLLESK